MALEERKIQRSQPPRIYPAAGKVKLVHERRSNGRLPQVPARRPTPFYCASSATTSLVAGSTSTTRLLTIMYLYWLMAGTSTATSCGTA